MRGETADETLATVEALIEGGAKMVEVTFTTPDICRVLGTLAARYGDKIVLVAGPVAPFALRGFDGATGAESPASIGESERYTHEQ